MTFPRVVAVFLLAVALLFIGNSLGASESWRILDSQTVDLGSRFITYNRVATPELKPTPAPTPVVEVVVATELEEIAPWGAKRDVSAFLSCTIYDKQFTVVEWQEDGQWVRFLSTINFHYLRGLSGFETANSYYSFFMMPGDSSREEFEEWRQFLARNSFGFQPSPSWPFALLRQQEQTGKSVWQLLSAEPVSGEVLRTIEDLHRYFDINREGLIRSYEEREAVRLAQEKWLQENPPTPKNTVVEFFPIRSSQAPDRLGRKSFNPSMPR